MEYHAAPLSCWCFILYICDFVEIPGTSEWMVVKAQARSAELGFVWGLYGLAVRVLEQTDTRVLFFFF